MMDNTALARQAIRGAARVRRRAEKSRSAPLCIFDVVERLGGEVKFLPIGSMEGLYYRGEDPVILLPAERPPGRQAFSCAHEYGHHLFGHGSKVDELTTVGTSPDWKDPEERLVNLFAAYLLMPRAAVQRAFDLRGWPLGECTSLQAYRIARQLGVGYQTIIQHMRWSLQTLSADQAADLLTKSPKELRASVLGGDAPSGLTIVDTCWEEVAVDLQVGDQAILPKGVTIEGRAIRSTNDHDLGLVVEAFTPGTERCWLQGDNWAINVRVRRKNYVGRSMFRHIEDPDDHE